APRETIRSASGVRNEIGILQSLGLRRRTFFPNFTGAINLGSAIDRRRSPPVHRNVSKGDFKARPRYRAEYLFAVDLPTLAGARSRIREVGAALRRSHASAL